MSAEAPITLTADEREAAREEVLALAGALADPESRQPLEELARALGEDLPALDPDQLERLTRVLELALESGRARRFQGAEGEGALRRVYARTPRGSALRRQAEAASRAASALAGRSLSRIEWSAVGPGLHRLELTTGDCRVSFEIGRAGISVESVGVEL